MKELQSAIAIPIKDDRDDGDGEDDDGDGDDEDDDVQTVVGSFEQNTIPINKYTFQNTNTPLVMVMVMHMQLATEWGFAGIAIPVIRVSNGMVGRFDINLGQWCSPHSAPNVHCWLRPWL